MKAACLLCGSMYCHEMLTDNLIGAAAMLVLATVFALTEAFSKLW